ncbi:MAG: RCC1 domain-containing protein [Polyangiaceae bacterium]
MLGLAAAGCGSSGEAGSGSTATAAPATSESAAAPATSSAAAAPTVDYAKRELLPMDIGSTTGEFTAGKAPEKTEAPQKVFRHLAGGKSGYCGAHVNGPIVCWGETPSQGKVGAFVQVAMGDKFLCGLENTGDVSCFPSQEEPSRIAASAPAAPATAAATAAATASADSPPPGDSASASGGDAPAGDPAAPAAPPADPKYRSIYAGPKAMCALDKATGFATCWKGKDACDLPAPPADKAFRSLAVGTCHVCGRDASGAVSCWAPEGTAAAKPPEGLNAKDLAAGDGFSCAVDDKGALSCWGSAPAMPADAPKEVQSVAARDGSVCVIAKGGALRCWGSLTVNDAGPFTAVTMASGSACANVAKDKLKCFGSEAGGQLHVPEDTSTVTVLDAGRNAEETAANKKKRADTFREFYAKLTERDAPVKIDRATKLPVGAPVEHDYQFVLDLVNASVFIPMQHYHYGFAVKAPDKKYKLVVVHDGASPKLMSFDENGKRAGEVTLFGYGMSTPADTTFDCGDPKEERVTEAEIGADGKVRVKTSILLEVLGRLKNKEGKTKNFCKLREYTDVYVIAPNGAINKTGTTSDTPYESYADEACRGKWIKNPRSEAYTASESMSDACMCRTGRIPQPCGDL